MLKAALPLCVARMLECRFYLFWGNCAANQTGRETPAISHKKPAFNPGVFDQLERAKRFELSTLTLARLCSTPELRPHPFGLAEIAPVDVSCKG